MSKKKKVKSDSTVASKPNHQKLKGVQKRDVKGKHSAGVSKLKNKQNLKESISLKSESKQNIKDNIVAKSNVKNEVKTEPKNKQNIKNNRSHKAESKQDVKNNNITISKKNKLLEKSNKHNIKNNEKRKSKNKQNVKNNTEPKPENTQNIQISNTSLIKKNKLLKKLNVNKLSTMLNAKEKPITEKSNKVNTTLSLRERMLAHLKGSRFRFINEQLYNSDSTDSKKYFEENPEAFHAYHEGYKQQVERWPINPLDVIIESIKKMPKEHIIADFGCGEAKLADSVPQTVHSFDLVAVNNKVKACDMANTPLLTGRVNVVVFCLSLMGSNLRDYLLEANRVLDKNGILKIAEVESRFDKIDDFIKLMSQFGFVNTWKDLSNNLFYFMDFKKTKDVLKKDAKKLPLLTLKPCLYKKR